jgi:general secretion pathway protein K
MRFASSSNERGYILAATLILLAFMAVIAARLAQRLDILRNQTSTVSEFAQALTNASSARAQALYLMASARPVQAGLLQRNGAILPVDGRFVQSEQSSRDGTLLSIQDERGLLSLNLPDRPALAHLLVLHGVPGGNVDHLLDCLEDYTDTDSLRRLNGAEAPDYAVLGLPPPRNDWLESPRELNQIIGWRDYSEAVAAMMPLLSSRRDSLYNANSAPRAVLEARFPRATSGQIDAFMARRLVRPFNSAVEAQGVTGLPFSSENDIFHPSDQYRVTIQTTGLPIAVEYTIRLTPDGRKRPWQFLDGRTVFLDKSQIPTDAAGPLQPPIPPANDDAQRPETI